MKVPCTECGAPILEATATRTGGLCMPCKTGTRASIEASKVRAKRERELDATDPFRIYWRELVHRVHEAATGFEGLSEAEKQYFAVGCLSGEVYNGGFDQFFFNSSGELYQHALKGLEGMGAIKSLKLLQKAKQVMFDFADIPKSTVTRRQRLATQRNASRSSRLEQLDKLFWADPDHLSELSQAFAIQHSLVPAAAQQGTPGDSPRPAGSAHT